MEGGSVPRVHAEGDRARLRPGGRRVSPAAASKSSLERSGGASYLPRRSGNPRGAADRAAFPAAEHGSFSGATHGLLAIQRPA